VGVLLNVTPEYLLIKDYVMAAKPICLTEYRRRKQEESRLKNANERDIPKPFDFGPMLMDPFSLWPFPDIGIEPTDSDGE
jgi:hypothetical protein